MRLGILIACLMFSFGLLCNPSRENNSWFISGATPDCYLSAHIHVVGQEIQSKIAAEIETFRGDVTSVFLLLTARNLYQLNANEFPLTLHYGFEGRIIILHKDPYRWRLQNDAKGMAIFC